MGFPTASDKMESSRKTSAPPPNSSSNETNSNQAESIPIRVIHEKHKYAPGPHSRTTDLPTATSAAASQRGPPEAGTGSPRVTRAHSEPPKAFNQRLLKTKIPLGNVSEQNEHNPVSTSASEPSVPHSQSEQTSSSVSGGGATSSGSPAPKPAATSGPAEPTVRHIPIRIEGREEPINIGATAKKPSDFYPSNVKVEKRGHREQPTPPNTLKVNNTKNVQNQEPTSPLSPIPSDQPIPMGYHEVDNAAVTQKTQNGEEMSSGAAASGATASASSAPPKPTTSGPAEPPPPPAAVRRAAPSAPTEQEPVSTTPIPMPCSPDYLQNQNKPSHQQPEQVQACPAPASASALAASTASVASAALKASEASAAKEKRAEDPCLVKLDKIMDNVHDLEKQISAFRGDKNSKEYKFLDEMLTRNLLALDGIDTAGRNDVRQQRKESIKSINRCLSILESKAKNQAEKNNAILSELAQQSSSK